MKYDYLIIGQGLAGSLLAWFALEKGLKPVVIDNADPRSASRVAAGLVNPITGRRMVKTWKADELLPFALKTYQNLEKELNNRFYFQKNIQKVFNSVQQENEWLARSADPGYKTYISDEKMPDLSPEIFKQPYGGIEISGSAYLDTGNFLSNFREYLKERELLIESNVNFNDIRLNEDAVRLGHVIGRYIIFCEGSKVSANPYFNWLPFNFVKGEVLTIHAEKLKTDKIINKNFWLLPLGKKRFRVGATYEWNATDPVPTEAGKEKLKQLLNENLNVSYEIIDHQAGIRPASLDIRPLIGLHPEEKRMTIFNGLGAKGVSLAPFFGGQLVNFLEENQKLSNEVNIERYYKRYEY